MTTSPLPAFGWTEHAEQTDAAALEAGAWRMATNMFGGQVITSQLCMPDTDTIAMLEAIWHKHKAHSETCTDPRCADHLKRFKVDQICPGGKFDPTVTAFITLAFDALGMVVNELRTLSLTPAEAKKNHTAACALITGAITTWKTPGPEGKPV